MPNFEQTLMRELDRLDERVQRLRTLVSDQQGNSGEEDQQGGGQQRGATGSRGGQEDTGRDEGGDTTPPTARTSGRRSSSRPSEEELVQMLNEAPTNKNGSIDLRTDAGRTLRAFGMVDHVGFPTEEAEGLMKTGRGGARRVSSPNKQVAASARR